MASERANFAWNEFTGGEWGPIAQGRADDPLYTKALAASLNGYPIEEGPWSRRSGTMFLVPTHGRQYARLIGFDGSPTCSFAMEFTNLTLRFLTQSSLVFDNQIFTIAGSNAAAGQLTFTGSPSGWAANDEIMFFFPDASSDLYPYPQALEVGFRRRLLRLGSYTNGSPSTITLLDDLGNPIDTTAFPTGWLIGAQVMRVKLLTTPYTGINQLSKLRAVQAETQSVILSNSALPQVVQITTAGSAALDPVFTFTALDMADGPYLDPQSMSLSLSAITGAVTATAGSAAFAATDVGRHLRVFTQPAAWASGTTYAAGNLVTGPSGQIGDWWVSLIGSNTGVIPGTSTTVAGVPTLAWAPAPNAGTWAWGKITAFTDSTHVTLTFDTTIPGMALLAANGSTPTAAVWQLGLFGAANPTCGTFYEGRLWLGGAVPNRFDTTVSNGLTLGRAVFSPTDPFNNVLDNSGISLTFNSKKITQINWMVPDHDGVLMGRLSGETLVAASSLGDPITPTSIQEHENTTYGSVPDCDPCRAGFPIIFAQRFGRRVLECFGDTFSGKLAGLSINKNAKHMTLSGVAQLEYQEETVPIIWTRMKNGLLAGCTYRRTSRFASSPPEMAGWHWHMHGGNRIFTNMCVVPGVNGLLDRLFTVTNDPPGPGISPALPQNYFIEIMQPFFDDQQSLGQAWFCDQSPGIGPGLSGHDCGGGNASAFTPTGGKGADTAGINFGAGTGPDMATVAPFPALDAAPTGQSPPAGGMLMLSLAKAVKFKGTDTLTNLPKFPARGASVDKTSMSISVWLGRSDMASYSNGALLASPALNVTEYNAANQVSSGFIGGSVTEQLDGGKASYAFSTPSGASGPKGAFANQANPLAGGDNGWTHVMISAKSVAGKMQVTLVFDETVILTSSDVGPIASNNLWPFHTQPDALKSNGLSQWTIGGRNTSDIEFTYNIKSYAQTRLVPFVSLLSLLRLQGIDTARGGLPYNNNGPPLMPGTTVSEFFQKAFNGGVNTVENDFTTASETGGLGNVPFISPTLGSSGFFGNVAEMWVMPGVFVDWTDAANRNKFHEQDPINLTTYGPISLGKDGSKPGFGVPWLYLSGDPTQFPLNRATGKWLTQRSTGSAFPGLSESDRTFPIGS